MRLKAIVPICILQPFALAVGMLFRIMHWSHGSDTILVSALLQLAFAALASVETARGPAPIVLKIFWISFYLLLFLLNAYLCMTRQALVMLLAANVISFMLYLVVLRGYVAPRKKPTDDIKFDSI